MNIIQDLLKKFINYLLDSVFDPNYQVEINRIETVYEKYKLKIESACCDRYFWRSICQYECQAFTRKLPILIFSNILALLFLPFTSLRLRNARISKSGRVKCHYLKIDNHMAYKIPLCIKSNTVEARLNVKYVTLMDLVYVIKLFSRNRSFHPELMLKFILWISSVRPYLDLYSPKYLLQYCEYSPYSSLRKLFLNSNGIYIANISHGEEVISCRSAFSSFDKYYMWDVVPKYVHKAMHIEYAEHIYYNPCEGLPPAPKHSQTITIGILWPSINSIDLSLLVTQIVSIDKYLSIVIRPHPNLNYRNKFEKHLEIMNVEVSHPFDEDIHNFIDRCNLVVGLQSAVLIQASLRQRDVLYIKDDYFSSLIEYHDYYKSKQCADLGDLSSKVLERFM